MLLTITVLSSSTAAAACSTPPESTILAPLPRSPVIDACNGYYCDGFKPNSPKKPIFWTEDWDGWYTTWGGRLPHRPVEDLAFAVARFFQRGGSFQNYYMVKYITEMTANLDLPKLAWKSRSLLSEPKWGHLKDLHAAIKLCEPALVAVDSAQYIKLGPKQEKVGEKKCPDSSGIVSIAFAIDQQSNVDCCSRSIAKAHVYGGSLSIQGMDFSQYGSQSKCSAFLANIDEHQAATVRFLGQSFTLPPWSVSILPDCRNTVFNTAKVAAQTHIKTVEFVLPLSNSSLLPQFIVQNEDSPQSTSWLTAKEPITLWSEENFTVKGILEHLNVTKDESDYLWYFTRIYVSDDDIAFWEKNKVSPAVSIDSMRDVLRVFINGQLTGSVVGHWVKAVQPVQFQKGYNELVLLSQTVGLKNYGAFLERDGAGFKGQIKLTGFKNGDIDLSNLSWTYQVGLKGEFLEVYSTGDNEKFEWSDLAVDATPSTFTWYKMDAEVVIIVEPTVLESVEQIVAILRKPGNVSSDMLCISLYHVPRAWLEASNNLLVVFEETGGNPFEISVKLRSAKVICAQVSESHYPPLRKWSRADLTGGNISRNDMTPEMHLKCQDGHIMSSIEFASYGTPNGSCQKFSRGNCHASNSSSVVTEACQGKNKCDIAISNAIFGDPCRGVIKTLAVEARCISSSNIGYSLY
ncbi:hypothetical protein POTOM_053619 [Populus tomentosa]|uniref:beta-galactosidase n=1 Tax=Populus tomentosa TaxID=118781 RepID=A0A8X7Y5H1_POPTO|nr:hypothetical protein POTOM_053619 [Populus tomentosa]